MIPDALIPRDMPFLAQVILGGVYGMVALAVVAAALWAFWTYLVMAPPAPLERAYALTRPRARAGRHTLAQGRERRAEAVTALLPVLRD